MKTSRRSLFGAFVSCAVGMPVNARTDPLKRSMRIHRVGELGLEIWTEAKPEWDTRLEQIDAQWRFLAETPGLVSPPVGMTWVSKPGSLFAEGEIEAAARGAIHRVASSHGISDLSGIEISAAQYGDLKGFQAAFASPLKATPVDVLMFLGHAAGRPAVVMQACTLMGKLRHIDGYIRRSWTNVRYIK